MAALQAERGYGLSCGRLGRGTRVSVFHVKLTESALRAFESYQACKVRGGGRGTAPARGLWPEPRGGAVGLWGGVVLWSRGGGGSAPCGAGADFGDGPRFGGLKAVGGVGCALRLRLRLGGFLASPCGRCRGVGVSPCPPPGGGRGGFLASGKPRGGREASCAPWGCPGKRGGVRGLRCRSPPRKWPWSDGGGGVPSPPPPR